MKKFVIFLVGFLVIYYVIALIAMNNNITKLEPVPERKESDSCESPKPFISPYHFYPYHHNPFSPFRR